MRWSWLCLLVAACNYRPGSAPSDGIAPDGPATDAPVTDAPKIDAPLPDARDCNAIATPAGCTAVVFSCAGSPSCFVLCTNARNHANAKLSCGPGTLAVPSTQEENDCVRNFVVGVGGGDNVWIGLEQINGTTPDSNWFWVDGTPQVLDGWGNNPDQPDDSNNNENGSEDCGNLEPAVGFAWNDDDCDESHRYLCELP